MLSWIESQRTDSGEEACDEINKTYLTKAMAIKQNHDSIAWSREVRHQLGLRLSKYHSFHFIVIGNDGKESSNN
jgi:hypothetical protein